ncbi:hypothetical protein [Owenweeksia hongkongensis]|uniref:hypothetical protein n=1 Tax=Owenweeksia hongkongensis TaxID=253245 RepID=UPI003A912D5A
MKFLKKALFYLLGVGLGTMVVVFMFGDRDDIQCTYFPNDRVLYDIRGKQMVIPADIQRQLDESSLDSADIRDMLTGGKVDFEKTDRGMDSCKTYWIDLKREDRLSFAMEWQNCDSVATALEFKKL